MDAETPPFREQDSGGIGVLEPGRKGDTDSRARPDHHEWPEGLRDWMHPFLDALAHRPVVRVACIAARVSHKTVYEWRQADKVFAECWEQAMLLGWDRVEEAAHVRAVDGVEREYYDANGKLRRKETVYSDGLAEMLLRGNRPEKYRDSDKPVQVGVSLHLNELLSRIRQPGMPRIPESQRKPKPDTMLLVDADASAAKPIKGGPGRV